MRISDWSSDVCSSDLIAVAALIAGLALAQSGYAAAHDTASGPRLEGLAPPAAGQSPFLGKWELDLARMPDTYGPAPKRVTFAFEDVGSGRWRTVIEIHPPNRSEERRVGKECVSTVRFGWSPSPSK